jgi:hypothetical protein
MSAGDNGIAGDWNPMEALPDHFLVIAYGLRRSGKSVLMRQMLYDIWPRIQSHKVYLFSQTASVNADQYTYLPGGEFKVSDISGANLQMKLTDIINEQKEKLAGSDMQTGDGGKKKKGKEGKDKGDSKKRKPEGADAGGGGGKRAKGEREQELKRTAHKDMRTQNNPGVDVEKLVSEAEQADKSCEQCKDVLILLDDCCNDQAVRSCPALGYLATCGRHLRISVIILSQVVAGSGSVPPVVRTQADVIICVAQPRSMRERELISEQYLTAENKPGAKQAGLMLLESVTAIPFRALIIECCNNAAREFCEYCYTYGPVPFPFPFEDTFQCGLPDQFETAKEEEDGQEYHHDFYRRHQAANKNLPQTDAPAFMEERNPYDLHFQPMPFLFSKVPFRLKAPGTNGEK